MRWLLLCLLAVPAWAEDRAYLMAGVEHTWGYGELPPAALLQAAYESDWLDARARVSTMRKVESDAGFILGAEADLHRRVGPLVGLGYTYRDGGEWVKHALWLRAGLAFGALVLVGRADMTTQNRSRAVALRLRAPVGDWAFESRVGVGQYRQGDGTNMGGELSLSFGRSFGRVAR